MEKLKPDDFDAIDKHLKHEQWLATVARWMSGIAIIVTFVIVVAAFFTPSSSMSFTRRTPTTITRLVQDVDQLKENQAEIEASVAELRAILAAATSRDIQVDPSSRIATIAADLQAVTVRLDLIDNAIVENPTKALSVPLMRHDLESLKASLRDNRDETDKQIDRVYDLSKWLIGGMAIAVLGLAASNYLQFRVSGDRRRNDTGDAEGKSLMTVDGPKDQQAL